jgi:putative addiction module component (TIGR02574 family)
MKVNEIQEIAKLSIPEKILLVEDLWDNIISNESAIAIPQSHITELKKRFKKYQTDPDNLLTIDELQTKVEKRK